jgi:integrase
MKNGIAKRGSSWSYVVRVPDPKNGGTKPKWIGGFSSEQEAKKARDKARVAVAGGGYVAPSKITVAEFLLSWLEIHSHSLKPSTEASYRGHIINHLIPGLGSIKLSQLRPSHVQKFFVDMKTSGGNVKTSDGTISGPLSARTVQYSGAILSKALKYAVEVDGILTTNVAAIVPRPKGSPRRLEPFTPEQIRTFLEGISGHRLAALYRLAIYSGARLGEILALNWNDLDIESTRLSISKNRIRANGKSIDQNSTKGGEGRRTIDLDPATIEILKSHRKRQLQERLLAGSEWQDTGYIFVTEFGKPIDVATPSHLFQKTRGRLELPEQRFHDVRHFHATQLLKAGIPLHVVAHRLGHRDAMVTATIYAHVTAEQSEKASQVFARAVE